MSNIKLPNQNTTIRSYTFAYCTSLEYLVIPGTVTCIEDYAFYGIHNPFKVYFEGAGCVVGYTDVPVTTYYYSESESGGCWRYVDGVPTPW